VTTSDYGSYQHSFVFKTPNTEALVREADDQTPVMWNTSPAIVTFEVGKTYKLALGPKPPNLPMDGAAGIIVNTIFGPVEFAGAVGDYGHARFFFRIGRTF